jgi:hypothetical protein
VDYVQLMSVRQRAPSGNDSKPEDETRTLRSTMCLSWLCLRRIPISTVFLLERLQVWFSSLFHCLGQITYNAVDVKMYTLEDELEYTFVATEPQMPEKRTAPETSSGINSLIAAANKNDRFHLLEDDVPAANLNNPIHPIFWWFECDGPMKQMLHLASQFLTHDSVLTFFVPLLFGRELTKANGETAKSCLSNPFLHASEAEQKELLDGVRQALHCLAHSLELRFIVPEKRVYARTLTSTAKPGHTSVCSPVFQRNLTVVIEIADRFSHFYYSEDSYNASSRCAQFRHDFLFASTLIHEIVHSVGVLRRGNLVEPCIHTDHPDTEWGYAWEHFIFGCVINPQDRTQSGTHLLMRKVWAGSSIAEEAGGKEYCDVPISYVAQWFREETWGTIADQGPTAIPLPTTHFKIQSSRKFGAWIVSTDCPSVKQDIIALNGDWRRQSRKIDANGLPISVFARIFWRSQTTEVLQKSNVQTPLRMPWRMKDYQTHGQEPLVGKVVHTAVSNTAPKSRPVYQIISNKTTCSSRKRKAGSESDTDHASKMKKRKRKK